MMSEYDPFETLVRIYLEKKGYLVRTNVPFGSKELDILAVRGSEIILGNCRTNLGRRLRRDTNFVKERFFSEAHEHLKKEYPELFADRQHRYVTYYVEMIGKKIGEQRDKNVVLVPASKILKELIDLWEGKIPEKTPGPRTFDSIDWVVKLLVRLQRAKELKINFSSSGNSQ